MMLLTEISHEINVDTFVHLVRGALSAMAEGNETARSILASGGDTKTAKRLMKRKQTMWFVENFPTLKSAAYSLKRNGAAFNTIANIATTAYKSDSDKANPEHSKSAGFEYFLQNVEEALVKINRTELIPRLKQVLEQRDKILAGITQDDKPSKPARVIDTDKKQAQEDELKGQQNQQVEKFVNDTISSLPVSHQANARRAVAKAGNKLLALHSFMKDNNLK